MVAYWSCLSLEQLRAIPKANKTLEIDPTKPATPALYGVWSGSAADRNGDEAMRVGEF
jgi:hypothetical protein